MIAGVVAQCDWEGTVGTWLGLEAWGMCAGSYGFVVSTCSAPPCVCPSLRGSDATVYAAAWQSVGEMVIPDKCGV